MRLLARIEEAAARRPVLELLAELLDGTPDEMLRGASSGGDGSVWGGWWAG
jgi:hypothetical protein